MKSVNMVVLMGNMTRDAELRYTPNGKAVASFGLAVNRTYKDAAGEKQSSVDFFDVVSWGKLAEIISQYGKKGQGIHVIGRLQTRNWEAQDGTKRNKTEIVATDVSLVGGKGGESGSTVDPPSPEKGVDEPAPEETPAPEEEISIDEIPF